MNGYQRVKYAIVEQAIFDYKRALKKKNQFDISTLEWFFMSEWGQGLSEGYGAFIIEQCRKCVGTKPKPRKVK